MVHVLISPPWFFGYDVAFQVSFAIISLIVSLFAFKIYKETNSRLTKYFGVSFLLISVSYFIQSILNFLILMKVNQNICSIVKLQHIAEFEFCGIFTHIFLLTLGLSILLYTTLKDKRKRTLWLLIIVAFAAIFMGGKPIYMFYVVSTIYLSFISYHFIANYLSNKKITTLLVAIAFLFLLFGTVHFLIAVNHQLFYAIGHILEFFAYAFILANLYLIRKK